MARNHPHRLSSFELVTVALLAASVVAPASVVAGSGTAVLTGTVTDAGSGEPLQRIELRAENRAAGAFNWTYTGSDGTYRVEIPAGDLLVGFHANQTIPPSCQDTPREMDSRVHNCDAVVYDHEYAPELRSIHAGAGEQAVHVQLERLQQVGSGIQGWVVDLETGEPIADATVVLHDLEPDRWARTTTDGNGAWAFQLDTGPVTLRAIAEGYRVAAATETVRSPPTETLLQLASGETLQEPVEHGFAQPPPDNESRWADLAAPTDAMGPPPVEPGSTQRDRASPSIGPVALVGLIAIGALGLRRSPR